MAFVLWIIITTSITSLLVSVWYHRVDLALLLSGIMIVAVAAIMNDEAWRRVGLSSPLSGMLTVIGVGVAVIAAVWLVIELIKNGQGPKHASWKSLERSALKATSQEEGVFDIENA